MDITDPRFAAIYDNPLYNVDPSAPEFKRSKTMEAILEEKVKRKSKDKADGWQCTWLQSFFYKLLILIHLSVLHD